ncbi:hypothetical protein Tco_0640666 [Tanacetum coccineum]
MKKCHADEPLAVPLDGLHLDDKLHFVEEPFSIVGREVKRLKRSRIPLVKVRWNSKRGPEFTWEREDQFKKKYPHLFTKTAPSSSAASLEWRKFVEGNLFELKEVEVMQQGQSTPTWVSSCGFMNEVCGSGVLESKVMGEWLFFVVGREAGLRGKFTLSPLDVLQGFSFFLQMGFTLILATLDGLDVGLDSEDVIERRIWMMMERNVLYSGAKVLNQKE